jgi:hypothetical protein
LEHGGAEQSVPPKGRADYIVAEICCELIYVDVRGRARPDAVGLPDEKHPMAAEHSNKKRSEAQRQRNAMRAKTCCWSQP